MPRILVVNDDGLHGPGLPPLVAALRPLGRVTVVVPDQERSTTSHALTLHRPVRLRTLERGFHILNGLPSDCARFGILELLKDRVDLVVSGINHGLNIGDDTLYSGTVAGAMEGTLLDVPSIAFSQDGRAPRFERAARFAAKLAARVLREGLPAGVLLNVNFPASRRYTGVEVTRLCRRHYGRTVHAHKDPRGILHYWLAGEDISSSGGRGSDAAALKKGRISITPLKIDMTDHEALSLLRKWDLEA